jgi:hypothetical protein
VSSFLLRKATGSRAASRSTAASSARTRRIGPSSSGPGAATFDTAAQWLRSQSGQRFMLFIEVPADGAMPWREPGRALKERRLYDKATMIVVGGAAPVRHRPARRRHAARSPDREAADQDGAGRRVPAPVQHVDVLPTVLDLVRAPIPGGLRGRSLRAVLDDSDETVPVRPLYAESLTAWYRFGGRPSYALTSDGARLVRESTTAGHARQGGPAEPDAGRARRRGAQRRARSSARQAHASARRGALDARRRALRAARHPDGGARLAGNGRHGAPRRSGDAARRPSPRRRARRQAAIRRRGHGAAGAGTRQPAGAGAAAAARHAARARRDGSKRR